MIGGDAAGLWIMVIAMGLYHGLSPGMGWPLAVSAALFEGRLSALFKALLTIGAGHFVAIGALLLPFAAIQWIGMRASVVRAGGGLLVMAFGVLLLIRSRHPRILARVRPNRLLLWAFLIAIAHGAGFMLVPMYLGIVGHLHVQHIAGAMPALWIVLGVSMVHTLAMVAGASILAWLVYRYLGLRVIRESWFNLDRLWAISLVAIGAAGAVSS